MQDGKSKRSDSGAPRNIIIVIALFIILVDILDLLGVISVSELLDGKQKTADLTKVEVTVNYIDVGQGDAIYIDACGRDILIDAGESSEGAKVVSYLRNAGVKKLDMIIVTHPHSDHIGGMAEVVREIGAETIILPKLPDEMTPTSKSYEKFLTAVSDSGVKLTPAVSGDEYRFGDAYLKIFSPATDSVYDNMNNYSVVSRLTYKDTSFLFMGDAEEEVEKELREFGQITACDVLKVGHHGSDTSSSKKFLEAVAAKYAVIMCGEDNSYNHPNVKTIERLEKYRYSVLRTDLNGTIVIGSDGSGLEISTEKQ